MGNRRRSDRPIEVAAQAGVHGDVSAKLAPRVGGVVSRAASPVGRPRSSRPAAGTACAILWSTLVVIILFAFLLFLLCWAVVAAFWGLALTVLGVVKRRRAPAVRGLALVCGALGVGGYALGAALVVLAQSEASHGTDSSPAPACWQANLETVTGHRAGYVPLRFDCVLEDGTTRSAGVVSGWLTPVAVVLAAAGVGLSVDRHRKPAARVG